MDGLNFVTMFGKTFCYWCLFLFLIHKVSAKQYTKKQDLLLLECSRMTPIGVSFCRADAEQHQSSEVVDECEREGWHFAWAPFASQRIFHGPARLPWRHWWQPQADRSSAGPQVLPFAPGHLQASGELSDIDAERFVQVTGPVAGSSPVPPFTHSCSVASCWSQRQLEMTHCVVCVWIVTLWINWAVTTNMEKIVWKWKTIGDNSRFQTASKIWGDAS